VGFLIADVMGFFLKPFQEFKNMFSFQKEGKSLLEESSL
jgi:hypothetical protein